MVLFLLIETVFIKVVPGILSERFPRAPTKEFVRRNGRVRSTLESSIVALTASSGAESNLRALGPLVRHDMREIREQCWC